MLSTYDFCEFLTVIVIFLFCVWPFTEIILIDCLDIIRTIGTLHCVCVSITGYWQSHHSDCRCYCCKYLFHRRYVLKVNIEVSCSECFRLRRGNQDIDFMAV